MISDELIRQYWDELGRAEREQLLVVALTTEQFGDLLRERDDLLAEQARLCALVAEHERTQATGGPAPAMTRNWGNEQHVPPPESAARRDMDPPTRYGASNQRRSKP